VIRGSLQLIPVGNSLLYIRPFYVRGSGEGGYPKFQFVAVYTQDGGAVCAPTVNDGLAQLFGQESPAQNCASFVNTNTNTGTGGGGGTATTSPPTTTTPAAPSTSVPSTGETTSQLIADANNLLSQAQQVLKSSGDLGQYQSLVNQAQQKLQQAQQQGGQ
jgi:hypothetical protein